MKSIPIVILLSTVACGGAPFSVAADNNEYEGGNPSYDSDAAYKAEGESDGNVGLLGSHLQKDAGADIRLIAYIDASFQDVEQETGQVLPEASTPDTGIKMCQCSLLTVGSACANTYCTAVEGAGNICSTLSATLAGCCNTNNPNLSCN
jgi:hypothetical protein